MITLKSTTPEGGSKILFKFTTDLLRDERTGRVSSTCMVRLRELFIKKTRADDTGAIKFSFEGGGPIEGEVSVKNPFREEQEKKGTFDISSTGSRGLLPVAKLVKELNEASLGEQWMKTGGTLPFKIDLPGTGSRDNKVKITLPARASLGSGHSLLFVMLGFQKERIEKGARGLYFLSNASNEQAVMSGDYDIAPALADNLAGNVSFRSQNTRQTDLTKFKKQAKVALTYVLAGPEGGTVTQPLGDDVKEDLDSALRSIESASGLERETFATEAGPGGKTIILRPSQLLRRRLVAVLKLRGGFKESLRPTGPVRLLLGRGGGGGGGRSGRTRRQAGDDKTTKPPPTVKRPPTRGGTAAPSRGGGGGSTARGGGGAAAAKNTGTGGGSRTTSSGSGGTRSQGAAARRRRRRRRRRPAAGQLSRHYRHRRRRQLTGQQQRRRRRERFSRHGRR